jgi:hypothetical protein
MLHANFLGSARNGCTICYLPPPRAVSQDDFLHQVVQVDASGPNHHILEEREPIQELIEHANVAGLKDTRYNTETAAYASARHQHGVSHNGMRSEWCSRKGALRKEDALGTWVLAGM